MSLIPTPVINDGTADRTFVYKGQNITTNQKTSEGTWIEPAALLSANSNIVVKYDESKVSFRRRLVQYAIRKTIADGVTLKPIVVNVTIQHHPEHTSADMEKAVRIACGIPLSSGFITRWLQGLLG